MIKQIISALITAAVVLTAMVSLSAYSVGASSQPEETAQTDSTSRYYYDELFGVRLSAVSSDKLPQGLHIVSSRIIAGELYDAAKAVADVKDFLLYDIYILDADNSIYSPNADDGFELAVPLSQGYEIGLCEMYKLDAVTKTASAVQAEYDGDYVTCKSAESGLYVLVDAGNRQNEIDGGLGDIDLDGDISAADARLALRLAVGYDDKLSGTAKMNADVDEDGSVSAYDARFILRYSVGLV